MTMDAQIGSVVSGSHHLLRLLCRLTPFIPKEDIAVVVGTIINSRLDYANALYLGLPKYQITRLQVVQNTAARLEKNRGSRSPFRLDLFTGYR